MELFDKAGRETVVEPLNALTSARNSLIQRSQIPYRRALNQVAKPTKYGAKPSKHGSVNRSAGGQLYSVIALSV